MSHATRNDIHLIGKCIVKPLCHSDEADSIKSFQRPRSKCRRVKLTTPRHIVIWQKCFSDHVTTVYHWLSWVSGIST
jgi:hypothetical protein